MIARLSGILAELAVDGAIIDVGGVGYLVHASAKTLDALGPIGGEVLVLTELQVREDAWALFGFGSTAERDAFRLNTESNPPDRQVRQTREAWCRKRPAVVTANPIGQAELGEGPLKSSAHDVTAFRHQPGIA